MTSTPMTPTRAAPSAGPAGRRDNVPLGIGLMVGATVFLTLSNVIAKHLVARYPVGEVMALRSLVALGLAMAWLLPRHGLAVFATRRPAAHVGRGLSQAVSQSLTVAALGLMPLAGVTAIGFSAPLFAAVIGMLVAREASGPVRWGVLVAGFLGVLVVTDPGADSLQVGALFALGNAVMYGSVTVAVRSMSKTEAPATLLAWQMAVMAAAHLGLLALGARWPEPADWLMLIALGCVHIGAQALWTRALALAPASAVSPFYYLMLVWSMALGFLVFGEVPDLNTWIGGAIVVAAGILLLWHEAAKRPSAGPALTRPAPRPAPAPAPAAAGSLRPARAG